MDPITQNVINATIALGIGPDTIPIAGAFTDFNCFLFLLERCRIRLNERNKLTATEGILSMHDLVNTFTDTNDLKKALHRLNDTFASATVPADRCYFTAFAIKNLMGVHYYV